MAVTLEQVRGLLEAEEPDYTAAARLGSEAVPHLETLVRYPDEILAARVVYLASLIRDPRAVNLLLNAAANPSVEIRVQVAAGSRNLSQADSEKVLLRALDDSATRVRIVAVKALKATFPNRQMPQTLA